MRRPTALMIGLALLAAACIGADPPWMNAEGQIVSASSILEYRGFRTCETQSVTFLQFFGRQYASDPNGSLGTLTAEDGSGRVLTFEFLTEPPQGARPTGFVRGEREIYAYDIEIDDYLYVVSPTVVERWPRAEVYCGDQARPS